MLFLDGRWVPFSAPSNALTKHTYRIIQVHVLILSTRIWTACKARISANLEHDAPESMRQAPESKK